MNRHKILVTTLSALSLSAFGTVGSEAAQLGEIGVTPDSGLTDGQTVLVSGSGFQKNRELRIVECGPTSDTRPPVYAICSNYSVQVASDADGNLVPQGFTVSTTVVGSRLEHGQNVPTTFDCLPANDCHLHVFAPVNGLASANHDLSFSE
jgi:Neocarzinostatin family